MSYPKPVDDMLSEPELEALTQELLSNQLVLSENVANISQFLKVALTVVNANLSTMQTQLAKIQELAAVIEDGTC